MPDDVLRREELDRVLLRSPGSDWPATWHRQRAELDRLAALAPDAEFLEYLGPILEMTFCEYRPCRTAIRYGACAGERSGYGYVTTLSALTTWLADYRARNWFRKRYVPRPCLEVVDWPVPDPVIPPWRLHELIRLNACSDPAEWGCC